MGGCCCRGRQRHAILVDQCYPVQDGQPLIEKSMNDLSLYAAQFPQKLSKIGMYIQEKVEVDLRNNRFGHVRVSMEILERLMKSCQTHLTYFANSVVVLVEALLEQREQSLKVSAVSTFVAFSSYIGEEDTVHVYRWSEFVGMFSSMCYESRGTDSLSLSVAGLKGLRATFCTVNVLDSHLTEQLTVIIPAVLHNMRKDGPLVTVSDPDEEIRDPKTMGYECMRDLARHANRDTLRRMLPILFNALDEGGLWSPDNRFAIECLQLIIKSGEAGLGYLPLIELLEHVDNDRSVEDRTGMIQVIAEMLRNVRSTPDAHSNLTFFNFIRTQLQQIVQPAAQPARQRTYEDALLSSISVFSRKLSEQQKSDGIRMLVAKAEGTNFGTDTPEIYLRALRKVLASMDGVPTDPSALALLMQILFACARSEAADIRVDVQLIIQELFDEEKKTDGGDAEDRMNAADKKKSADAFITQHGDQLRGLLYDLLLEDSNLNVLQSVANTLISLMKAFRWKDLEKTVPLLFKVQSMIQSGDVKVAPTSAASVSTVFASYLFNVGTVYSNKSLQDHVYEAMNRRAEAKQMSGLRMKEDGSVIIATASDTMSNIETESMIYFDRALVVELLCKPPKLQQQANFRATLLSDFTRRETQSRRAPNLTAKRKPFLTKVVGNEAKLGVNKPSAKEKMNAKLFRDLLSNDSHVAPSPSSNNLAAAAAGDVEFHFVPFATSTQLCGDRVAGQLASYNQLTRRITDIKPARVQGPFEETGTLSLIYPAFSNVELYW